MKINLKTKQHIVDELKTRHVVWFGKLEEQDFVAKLVDMNTLPSNDPRYENMQGDFWQHRINNPNDWDDDWIYSDERIGLLKNDQLFSDFITELLHPSTREGSDSKSLKEMINYYLKKDGYQIVEDEEYYEENTSTYKIVEINPTQIEKSFRTTDSFVHEAYEKIDKRLRDEDYSGAVTSSRTLIEYTIKDIYSQITGDTIDKIDDLQDGFKKIQKLLKLDFDKTIDDNKKKILRSFVTIINSLAPLFNSLGDRHGSKSSAGRNTALFCTDSTKIFVNFLYGRLQDIHGLYPSLFEKLIKCLNSDLRLKTKKELLADKSINEIISFCDEYIIGFLIDKHIDETTIDSFRESDIFFAFLRIFSNSLKEAQLIRVLNTHSNNGQAVGWENFLKELFSERRDLFTKAVLKLISESRELSEITLE